jgi:F-type H+-transporting ATPase subunit epsilon
MADRTPFPFRLVTPEGSAWDAPVQMAIVTGTGGDLGLLAKHAPIVADLKLGTCKVLDEEGTWHAWATAEGFATTSDSVALALVEEAVEVDKIDVADAEALISEHSNSIADGHGGHDVYSSNVKAAEKSIAWGEHLKKVAAETR